MRTSPPVSDCRIFCRWNMTHDVPSPNHAQIYPTQPLLHVQHICRFNSAQGVRVWMDTTLDLVPHDLSRSRARCCRIDCIFVAKDTSNYAHHRSNLVSITYARPAPIEVKTRKRPPLLGLMSLAPWLHGPAPRSLNVVSEHTHTHIYKRCNGLVDRRSKLERVRHDQNDRGNVDNIFRSRRTRSRCKPATSPRPPRRRRRGRLRQRGRGERFLHSHNNPRPIRRQQDGLVRSDPCH